MKKNDFPDGFRKKWSMRKKIIMRIKLFAVLICFVGLTGSFASTAQTKLKLNIKNTTIKNVLNQIENQSEYSFMYDASKINVDRKINLTVENSSVEDILKIIFPNQNVFYRIIDRHIIISKKSDSESGNILFSQQYKKISGKVTDSSGASIPGVNVVLKGTKIITITDSEGRYSLANVFNDATLVFSFVGMKTLEIALDGKTSVNVVMEETTIGIEEVIAIGYGTAKRSDITGSISSIPMELSKNQPVRGLSDLMQGRVAGIVQTTTNGDISGSSKIRIRGANSISGNNDPLYVVDGIIGGSYGSIHDVASVEVLKDASATAIYGERASNGVILITTKKASSSKPVIQFNMNTGFQSQNTNYDDKMNAAEYASVVNDIYSSTVFSDSEISDFEKTGGTDWVDMVMQSAIVNDHNISYSQKVNNKTGIYASGRYSDAQGAMINSKSGGDYSLRSRIDFEPAKNLKVSLDVKASRAKSKNGGNSTGINKSNSLFQALIWSPTEPVWDNEEEGEYHQYDSYSALWYNPYMKAMERDTWKISHNINATLDVKYDIFDFLSYNVLGYTSTSGGDSGSYNNSWLSPGDESADRSSYDNSSWRLINTIDFHKTFNNVHNVSAIAVYESEYEKKWSLSGTGKDLPVPDLSSYWDVGLSDTQSTSSGYSEGSRLAFLGRLNYNYMSRYYFTASYRLDAKSGPTNRVEENKWGGFPSFAVSWRLSEESFMEDSGFDNLKLRLGWGKTGNPCGWEYTTMTEKGYDYGIGANYMAYIPGTPANDNLKWETTTQIDAGLDFSIMKGKLSFSFDYYHKLTNDLLTSVELPMYYGYGYTASYSQNLGEIKNTGYEFTVDATPIQTKNLVWKLNFNISKYNNEVKDLGNEGAFLTGTTGEGLLSTKTYRVEEGLSLSTMWGYKCLGIWGTDETTEAAKYGEQPGDYKYEDVNGDGVISMDDDAQKIGDSNPDFTYGLSSSLSYKNFDFNILIQGLHGQDVFNVMRGVMASVHGDARMIMLKGPGEDYWTESNQDSEWPNIHSSSNTLRLNSTKWIEEGSWLKIRNIGVTYNIPRRYIAFADVAFTVSGQNILTLSKYKGFDPEVSASGSSDLWGGFDFGTVPIPKRITLGVNVTF